MEELRRELASYVQRVDALTAEYDHLRSKLDEAESKSSAVFEQAKASMREQALLYGEAIREKGKDATSVAIFRKELEVTHQSNLASVYSALASSLLPRQQERQELDVTLQDFDVDDQHLATIVNRTAREVNLQQKGYTLHIRGLSQSFAFPASMSIPPGSAISVWYGLSRASLANPEGGSLHWSGLDSKSVITDSVVELRRGNDDVAFALKSNQSVDIDQVFTSTPSTRKAGSSSSSKSGSKRSLSSQHDVDDPPSKKKRAGVIHSANRSIPLPRLSSSGHRRYGPVRLLRLEATSDGGTLTLENTGSALELRNWKLLFFGARLLTESAPLGLGSIQAVPTGVSTITLVGRVADAHTLIGAVFLVDERGCAISCLSSDDELVIGGAVLSGKTAPVETSKETEGGGGGCCVQ